MEFLSEYDFDIKHIKGKENKVVDTLNKRLHEFHAKAIRMYNSYLKRRILEVVTTNQNYVEIKKYYRRVMHNKNLKITSWKRMESFCI
jgi:hypothetical protein